MPAKSRREFSGVAGGRWARTVLWLKPEKTSVTAILLSGLTLVALYWFPMRRWFGRWGTTATDLTRVMVGDAAIVDPKRTRLVSRNRVRVPPSVGSWVFMRVIEPAAFLLTRRMLLGLKHRAEALAAAQGDRSSHAA